MELVEYLKTIGVEVQDIEYLGKPYVFVQVLLMGWSWAPWIANTLLGSILDLIGTTGHDSRVIEGFPVPRISPRQPVHWTFMDDFAVIGLLLRHLRFEESYMRRLQLAIAAIFKELGIILHKEDSGMGS